MVCPRCYGNKILTGPYAWDAHGAMQAPCWLCNGTGEVPLPTPEQPCSGCVGTAHKPTCNQLIDKKDPCYKPVREAEAARAALAKYDQADEAFRSSLACEGDGHYEELLAARDAAWAAFVQSLR